VFGLLGVSGIWGVIGVRSSELLTSNESVSYNS